MLIELEGRYNVQCEVVPIGHFISKYDLFYLNVVIILKSLIVVGRFICLTFRWFIPVVCNYKYQNIS